MKLKGQEEAYKAIQANLSPRYRRLEELERWSTGEQYQGRPSWWDGGPTEVPRWERAPCVVYPVVQVAISSNVDLVFGKGRFPSFTSCSGEDAETEDESEEESEGDTELASEAEPEAVPGELTEDESNALDAFIAEYHKVCGFPAHAREAFHAAQASCTAVAIHGHRNGKPFADLIPSKWGTAKFGLDGEVTELEIRYPYLDEFKNQEGQWEVKAKLYRRLITESDDTTFYPADASVDGTEPAWKKDPAKSIPHGLGFCPVVWYPFMRGCAPVNRVDGKAIHELLTDEIHQLDLALSTKQGCALHSEPQIIEIGVPPGADPTTEIGRTAIVMSTKEAMPEKAALEAGLVNGAYVDGSGSSKARKKGPGRIWSYPNEKSSVTYLAFPAGLLKEQEEHCNDLLSKIEQAMAVVLPKPSEFKFAGAVSGRSLQETKSRQYDRCDQYRDDLERHFLTPSISMQLRIAQKAREQLKVRGIKKALPALDKLASDAVEPA
ncbi:MAG TPA: hypothetical protein VGK73_11290 [Polyangiaceae bacterium]